jgi:DNA-directed RNA polymerase specialized sigma24 family protein
MSVRTVMPDESVFRNPLDEENFAELVTYYARPTLYILRKYSGQLPVDLVEDAYQEAVLELWLRLQSEPEFVVKNTKTYVAQWLAWKGRDRIVYRRGQKKWDRHAVYADDLQRAALASGSLDKTGGDAIDGLLFEDAICGISHTYRLRPIWTLAVEQRIDLTRAVCTVAQRYADDQPGLTALVAVTTDARMTICRKTAHCGKRVFDRRLREVRAELRELLI